MKTFFEKHGLSSLFALLLILIFVFGGMYSRYMTDQIAVHADNNHAATIVHLDYNFELSTFIESPYIATVNFGQSNQQALLYIGDSFQINGVVSGDQPTSDELVAIQLLLTDEAGNYNNTAYFDSYNSSSNTLIAKTIGFHGIITVQIVFSTDFSTSTYTVLSSTETYYEESLYQGTGLYAVEKYYMDGFVNGVTNLDAVAGASYGTSPAMQDLVDLLTLFQAAQTGGN